MVQVMLQPPFSRLSLIILCCFVLQFVSIELYADVSDPAYHTVEEINARLFALQDSVPNIVRVELIGHSQQDKIPIYAIKINKYVNEDISDRPAILFHDLHAEEILGIEVSMWLIERLVSHADSKSRDWYEEIDTWIVPTTNPEGVNVVFSLDQSWRKNKRNNLKDGRFRYKPGIGGDTSGVDLNRNFPLFWQHGHKLLGQLGTELYDYYRGPSPLSEAESQAIDGLVERIRPLYIVTLHSSRTGNFAEKIFYPWGRGNVAFPNPKFSPDIHVLDFLTREMVTRMWKIGDPGSNYLPAPISSWVGDCDSYFYWKYGSFAMRIEIGDKGGAMQPDSAGIQDVIESCCEGIEYMFNNAAGISTSANDDVGTRIDIKTTVNGEPTEAVLEMKTLKSAIMPFRWTSPYSGVYHWLVLEGFTDTLIVRKFGYYSHKGRVSYQRAGSSPLSLDLIPLPVHLLTIEAIAVDSTRIRDDIDLEVIHTSTQGYLGWNTSAPQVIVHVPLDYPNNEWQYTLQDGHIRIELPEGNYTLTLINGDDHVPRRVDVDLSADMTRQVILKEAVTLLSENFDGNDILYVSDKINNPEGEKGDSLARWELTNELYHSAPRCLCDTRKMNTLQNEDGWCAPYNMLDYSFDLETAGTAALVYWLNQALEPGYDSMWVEVSVGDPTSADPNDWTWTQAAPAHQELSILEDIPEPPWNAPYINLQQYAPWKRFTVPLDSFCGQSIVHFRFRLKSDGFIEEDGVYIDDIMLLASDVEPPVTSSTSEIPEEFELDEPYPNPFNGNLTVPFRLPDEAKITVTLYDLTGRTVLKTESITFGTGSHLVTIDAGSLPSGLYLLRGQTVFGWKMKKVLLIK